MERGSGAYHSIRAPLAGNTIILSLSLKTQITAINDEWKEKEALLGPTFARLV